MNHVSTSTMDSRVLRAYAFVTSLATGDSNAASVIQTIGVRIVLLAVNFGTGIIVARSLGAVGRGELAAIGLWPAFFAALATLGIPTALNYYTRRKPENGSQLYAASVVLMIAMGVIAAAVGAIIMPMLLRGYDQTTVRMAELFMVFTPQVILGFVIRARLEAIGDFRRSILSQLNPNVATLLALIALRLSGHITPVSAAVSYMMPHTVQLLWLAACLWPRGVIKIRDVVAQGQSLLGYGFRSYGSDVVGALASQLDLAVIVMFLNASELGLYSIALTLSRLLNIVQNSLVPVIFPRASALKPDEAIALIARAARLSTILSVALGAILVVAIPILLPRLYGSEFRAAIPLIPVLTAEAIIGGLGGVLKQGFLANGRPLIVTFIEVASIGSAVGLLFLLVPRMNILGAATALLFTSIVRVLLILAAYRFVLHRPIPSLLPGRDDLDYILIKIGKPPFRGARLANKA